MVASKKIKSHWFWISGIFAIITDQISKIIVKALDWGQLNTGGLLGFKGSWNWTALMVLVFVILLLFYLFQHRFLTRLEQISWGLIIGGGLANLIDRVYLNGVWDWIYYPVVNVVGNIADIWLSLAVCLLFINEIKVYRKHKAENGNPN